MFNMCVLRMRLARRKTNRRLTCHENKRFKPGFLAGRTLHFVHNLWVAVCYLQTQPDHNQHNTCRCCSKEEHINPPINKYEKKNYRSKTALIFLAVYIVTGVRLGGKSAQGVTLRNGNFQVPTSIL